VVENPVIGEIVRRFFPGNGALKNPWALEVIEEFVVKGGLGLLPNSECAEGQ